jgi:hypothetical protein
MVTNMSIPVELQNLAEVMTRYRFAYLLTSSAHGAPHAVAVVPMLEGSVLVIDGIGRRTRSNLIQQPAVGLIWPPREESDYSLIVDGQAAPDGEMLRITPSRAVLHRPARRPDRIEQGACGSDCVELKVPTDSLGLHRDHG